MTKKMLLAGAASLSLAACGTVGQDEAIETAAAMATAAADMAEAEAIAYDNPLLEEWTGPYDGVPQWQEYEVGQFDEAIEVSLNEALAEYEAIAANPAAPTFANTIDAMELAGQRFGDVYSIFGVYASNISTPEVRDLQAKWSPKISEAFDKVNLDPRMFARVKALYDNRDNLGLTSQQMRVLERRYDGYVRTGALLDEAGKAQLSAYNSKLAELFSQFSANVLADENVYTQVSEAEMAGVPADIKGAAKVAAEAQDMEGYAIKNTRSMVDPVLSFAEDRDLREKVWDRFVNRGDNGDDNDTNAIIAEIVKTRADRADLLGYESHAHWRMQDTMAGTPQRAMDLMMKVWPAAIARVDEEVADMMEFASADGVSEIEPWDYLYYQEKVRKAKYDLSAEELKPYFELNNMVDGMIWSAEQLYGISMVENTGAVPVYHPDIRTFEVTNTRTGKDIGLFYFDTYARDGKRSGAWMNTLRLGTKLTGDELGLFTNNNNFNKPAPGEPVLISLDDAQTLWHEFGHAIHYMLVDVDYPSLAGNQRDFVEYPSQVNENWLLSEPVLERFARHYETNEVMPQSLRDKIAASSTFNEGYATVQYLSSALVDMKLHMDPDGVVDVDAFEKETLAALDMPEETVMRHRLPQFNHLFSSDAYSAGYYSYLWSETMDADTWEAFAETGNVYDPVVAERFEKIILATGNATDRIEAYRAFRGRDPDVDALLRRRGFPTGAE
ncbi:M3 family metallopeptidase [Sphingomicrobium aestuariivivum]|uniref:M3 family metallopeptidase n=1 Tax=Sphingomicrobium aestuariivivum TaxID=1582356 RepID=UPI001FD6CBD6|nr:M3 family metallopeptidase [Sphingomicrobium aestuariivivum]MCJ8190381.1 M3 family metallopeptidase [Sphingomicrobium aestuariivivum]